MTELTKYICIHGHFYQPPRENPWLGRIEVQDSAAPFHDWNERVNAECYAPNAQARLLTDKGKIRRVLNNYVHISFNFGPTLLAWLEEGDPRTYAKIVEADRLSREQREGHGNALAQPYNHAIMPLASERDQRAQAVWGMEDFRRRFGRDPEGMWLPETAVNAETLSLLAGLGIGFTVLSPTQARRYREDAKAWVDLPNGAIDPSRPYHVNLPHGRSMALFFYDGPISQAIAFQGILNNGEFFLGRLKEAFHAGRKWPQLVHVANDGESFGHHHRFGEMALAYVIEKIQERGLATLTNYGQYLARHPPQAEVEILDNTSWSCVHGVERWRSDCGCNAGGHQGWNQKWRAPLREALDFLKRKADDLYESRARQWFDDPWLIRERYIEAVSGRQASSPDCHERGAAFARKHIRGGGEAASSVLKEDEITQCLSLLEMQHHTMLMFTSCAWFFDDLAGIEPVQNLRYAARALQLGAELGCDWEEEFLGRLAAAFSNDRAIGDGRAVYERFVRPSIVSLDRAVAHYAIVRALDPNESNPDLHAYDAQEEEFERLEDGSNALAIGRIGVYERVTGLKEIASFAALFFGGRDVQCGISINMPVCEYARIKKGLAETFREASLAGVLSRIEAAFPGRKYRLPDLFVEARRQALGALVHDSVSEMRAALRAVYDRYRPLMTLVRESEAPLPVAFQALGRVMLDAQIRRAVGKFMETDDTEPLAGILAEARRWKIAPNFAALTMPFKKHVLERFDALDGDPDPAALDAFVGKISKAQELGLDLPRWELQNRFHDLYGSLRAKVAEAAKTDARAKAQKEKWLRLAELLDFDRMMIE